MTSRGVRLTLRVRLMLLGLCGVTVVLVIASSLLYTVLGLAGRRALDETAINTAHDVSVLMARAHPPDPLPVSGAQLVQVLDGQDRVVAGSATADRLTPVLTHDEVDQARAGAVLTVPGERVGMAGPLRVVAVPTTRIGERRDSSTVLVAVQAGDVAHAEDVLRTTLLVITPVMLLVLGVIAWWVIGRALRPVEQLRAGAEAISGSGRSERLPVPVQGDEITALAVTLNGMLDRLAQVRERQRGFVADAAHELRSPLTSMRTQLEVEQHVDGGKPLTDGLLADVRRLSTLVEDLLLLARSDAGVRPVRSAEPLVVQAQLVALADLYAAARVPVLLAAGGDPRLTARVDRDELRRMLTNLIDNAVRHAQSAVLVTAHAERPQTLIVVEDDGSGIPADQRERVLERFARLDTARDRDAGGSGLGLAIVAELAQRVHGSVVLTDRLPDAAGSTPAGLRAEIRLPR